jgi:hypothetical protein
MWTLLAAVILTFVWLFVYRHRANKFQKVMRVGDKCSFYIDLDRHKGRIAYIEKDRKEVYP